MEDTEENGNQLNLLFKCFESVLTSTTATNYFEKLQKYAENLEKAKIEYFGYQDRLLVLEIMDRAVKTQTWDLEKAKVIQEGLAQNIWDNLKNRPKIKKIEKRRNI